MYTPVSTLLSESPIYFLGIYPGFVKGDPQPHNNWTIDEDLERLENDQICKHAYLEEKWGNKEAGQAKLQRRALHVFTILAGSEPAGRKLLLSTPASNMILLRNNDENAEFLRSNKSIVEECWHFHQAVIDLKQPELILVHGVGCAKELARARNLGECESSPWPSGYDAQPRFYAWQLPAGQRLLAIPNLGRYDPHGPREQALTRFFREAVPLGIPSSW